MERNTLTKICSLEIGDRFYKQTDKKKAVWTKVKAMPKQTYYQTYQHFAIKDGEQYSQPLKAETLVVFLRHAPEDV